MAFRYSGHNWAGLKWQTVPAITTLGKQIEDVRPGTLATDGTVASRGHDQVNPTSDHSPDENGDVRAIDFGGTTDWLAEAFEAIRLSKDPRVKYAIHDGKIFSSYNHAEGRPYSIRTYHGSNPHTHHIHVSVTDAQSNDATPWAIEAQDEETPPMALTPYEEAAIQSLLDDGVFTSYSVDEEGEVHAEVKLKTLAVFLMRITDRQEASDEAIWDAIKDIESGAPADLSNYVQKGEAVKLV